MLGGKVAIAAIAAAAVGATLLLARRRQRRLSEQAAAPTWLRKVAIVRQVSSLANSCMASPRGRLRRAIKRVRYANIATRAFEDHHHGSAMLSDVFDEAAVGGVMSEEQFIQTCVKTLRLTLGSSELSRIFAEVTRLKSEPILDKQAFVQCVRQRYFLAHMKRMRKCSFKVPTDFNHDEDTATNYNGGPEAPFEGPYANIRATRDHAYHGRYTPARQRWQDRVLETIVQRTESQPAPWLVFTCGGMGVGKGYALGWLSEQAIFPLEGIVHVDPDHFKSIMPEWAAYVAHAKELGDPALAGNRCHRESCYLQELALEEALRRKQNCWVDGSLRNARWFTQVFADIRTRFPDYRIAIIAVRASEATVRQRVAKRAALTGRSVPEALVLESLAAVDSSVGILGPQADFVAEVLNEGSVPRLLKVTTIDRSGAWAALKQRFARTRPAAEDFPASLAPIGLKRLAGASVEHVEERTWTWTRAASLTNEAKRGLLLAPTSGATDAAGGAARHEIILDPESPIALSDSSREQANVPEGATTVAHFRLANTTSAVQVGGVSLTYGGFAYWGIYHELVGVNALNPLRVERGVVSEKTADLGEAAASEERRLPHMIDFGPAEKLSEEEAVDLPASRWDDVSPAHHFYTLGARRVAWVMGYERLGHRMIATAGGFCWELTTGKGSDFIFFPLLCE